MPPNIHKHSLSEVPAEELINRSFGIPKEDLIEMGATNALILGDEGDDLVTVLRELLVVGTPRKILVILTSGLIDSMYLSKRAAISALSNIPFWTELIDPLAPGTVIHLS